MFETVRFKISYSFLSYNLWSDKLYEHLNVPRTALEESQNFENAKGCLLKSAEVSGLWTNL